MNIIKNKAAAWVAAGLKHLAILLAQE